MSVVKGVVWEGVDVSLVSESKGKKRERTSARTSAFVEEVDDVDVERVEDRTVARQTAGGLLERPAPDEG